MLSNILGTLIGLNLAILVLLRGGYLGHPLNPLIVFPILIIFTLLGAYVGYKRRKSRVFFYFMLVISMFICYEFLNVMQEMQQNYKKIANILDEQKSKDIGTSEQKTE
jgi:hypothetical protein